MINSDGKVRIGAIAIFGVIAFAMLSIAAITIIRAQLASSAWPMYMHDLQHTGQSQYDTSLDQGVLKWQFASDNQFESSPVIGPDGTIYIGNDDGYLYAMNPNGTEKWASQVSSYGLALHVPAVADDGTVYIGTTEGGLVALNPDGSQKWTFFAFGSILSAPAIGPDGTIYFGSADQLLYAITDEGQGSASEDWVYSTNGPIDSSPALSADGSTVYVGSTDMNLYAVWTGTDGMNTAGSEKWEFATSGQVESSPVIASDGTIYIAADD
ncbi:MAG TPA: PQQ-binding-like beta-propeller repeat protein, partial [Candidatus Binataceae bacterium]|nr:PQQ-binding-like beta-propeller repeat protein [Candidatus Binataceae bacterium]